MKLQNLSHKFICSDRQIRGKFQLYGQSVTLILLALVISLKALTTCYQFIDITQHENRIEAAVEVEPIQLQTLSYSQPEQVITIHQEKVIETVAPVEYDPPETIYDDFTKKEINMLYRLVEAEATSGNIKDKINVANVIYNRLYSDEFPDTIEEVVFQHTGGYYQFSCIADGRYYDVDITEDTKKAVYQSFINEDTTDGALFFCNKADVKNLSYQRWFNSLEFVMKDDIGHSYYK